MTSYFVIILVAPLQSISEWSNVIMLFLNVKSSQFRVHRFFLIGFIFIFIMLYLSCKIYFYFFFDCCMALDNVDCPQKQYFMWFLYAKTCSAACKIFSLQWKTEFKHDLTFFIQFLSDFSAKKFHLVSWQLSADKITSDKINIDWWIVILLSYPLHAYSRDLV